MELTEEQLRQMTPEQLQELQKANCVFCHIAAGKVQSKRIHEDDICLAVLDINPCNPGHVLIFPKEHYAILPQVPEKVQGHLINVAKNLSAASLRALKTQGTNVFIANGVSAGQKAPHVLIHLIPRTDGDGITSFDLKRKRLDDDHDDLARKLRQRLLKDQRSGTDKEKEGQEEETQEKQKVPEEQEGDEQKGQEEQKEEKGQQHKDDEKNPDERLKKEETKKEGTEKEGGSLDLDNIAKVLGLG
ncbi:MAG: HIT domain-containing protein [DPANN group archaeon]|nr:HIT domain-containing protein [DPANN group archaeon]